MSQPTSGSTRERVPLSRDRVLAGAITVADAGGIGALTIRTLAQELGVKPMSVYHYVANKDEIIDGIVDLVYAEITLPAPGGDWRQEMRLRANSARRVLAGHPWATPLLQSRLNPGAATLRHHNAFIATLRTAGFSVELTARDRSWRAARPRSRQHRSSRSQLARSRRYAARSAAAVRHLRPRVHYSSLLAARSPRQPRRRPGGMPRRKTHRR